MDTTTFCPWTVASQAPTSTTYDPATSTLPRASLPVNPLVYNYVAPYRFGSVGSNLGFLAIPRRDSFTSETGSETSFYNPVATTEALFIKSPEIKRARGRPRRYPIIIPDPLALPTKSRSKTGCYTCRRRKKKCDEAKPTCLNCKKNNTTCEGYPSEHAWKGGNGACIKPSTSPTCTSTKSASPRSSVEMDIDSTLLHHFKFSLSRILSIAQDEQNPYLRFILAMATRRRALMHAVLGLSGAHWSLKSSKADVETRGCYHLDYAIADLRVVSEKYTSTQEYVEDAAIGQALVVFLRCVIAPEERGKYCKLLEFVRYLVVHQGASDPEFQAFLVGFIVTYDVSNAVVSLGYRPSLQTEILQRAKELTTQSPAFLGVLDGFSIQLARITRIRDSVRVCRARGIPIKGDRVLLNEASAIDAELRAWQSSQPVNSDEHILSLLYRQCTWVYLYRTLLPASIHDIRLRDAVDAGIVALTTLTPDSAAYAMLLLPLFLLGCSAFQPSQRPAIDAAFGSLARYRKYAAVGYAQGVMHQMWQMMDAGDDRAWDWEDFTSKASLDWLVV